MSGFIQRDNQNNIISLGYCRTSDNDIEVEESFIDNIFSLEDKIENYFIKDDTIECRLFKISNTSNSLKVLEYSEDYDVNLPSLIINPDFKRKQVIIAFPPQYLEQYKDYTFRLGVDEQTITVNVNEFKNDFLVINLEFTEDSIFKISGTINHVVLTKKIKNAFLVKKNKEQSSQEENTVDSNIINIVKKSGKLKLPVFLRDQIAYYVNIENRNEIIDMVKTETEIDYIPNTVIIIGQYEVNAY